MRIIHGERAPTRADSYVSHRNGHLPVKARRAWTGHVFRCRLTDKDFEVPHSSEEETSMTRPAEKADALVIFGATGDLAKLETFPALVGLVERGVLDMPVIGVAKSGWGLDQFRGYASDSLTRNGIHPKSPAASKVLGLLHYIDGDLDSSST